MPSKAELAADARALVRRALKASLATIASGGGYPYASLITVATEASGAPIFLISGLAQHTRNLSEDPRASILFDGTGAAGDPLQGARVTLFGKAEKTAEEGVRRRFLARHPEAAFYADFPDFAFWRLEVQGAHYIGGFGRIVDLKPHDVLTEIDRFTGFDQVTERLLRRAVRSDFFARGRIERFGREGLSDFCAGGLQLRRETQLMARALDGHPGLMEAVAS